MELPYFEASSTVDSVDSVTTSSLEVSPKFSSTVTGSSSLTIEDSSVEVSDDVSVEVLFSSGGVSVTYSELVIETLKLTVTS